MENLYSFHWDCGRSGDLDGLFIEEEWKVKGIIGEEIYFGEVLGKHSEVYGTIEEGEIVKIDVPESVVVELKKAFKRKTISGFNPLDYYDVD